MSRSKVWVATISAVLVLFTVIVLGTYLLTGEVKAWAIGLAGVCCTATVAIGSSLASRSKAEPPSQGRPSQQTGTTFASGGSIAGLAAGNDINIGTPPTPRPERPDEGV
ncbi:hypothetical protein ACFTSF_26200 [Kribbella sp. NPDC056951]|uniref:hypothetical protein n=1 Tax=Kribbella sp. NPDC056951 TaxID=3345978 RepID=UPI00363C13FF